MIIDIGVHFPQVQGHNTPYLDAFCKGLRRHNNVRVHKCCFPIYLECDIAVCWAHRQTSLFNQQLQSGRHYLILERGFIGDRNKWTSIGYDGLNGRADFVVNKMPSDRFDENFKHLMRPWKEDGKYILINGQCRGDASVTPYIDFKEWARSIAQKCLKRFPDKQIIWRPHPIEVSRGINYDIPEIQTSIGNTLAEDMSKAFAVVTFNSNSGVDAVMAGVPTYAFDIGSMAWAMASHEIEDSPARFDRCQWAWDLAYKQWTLKEISSGLTWSYLKEKI